MLCTQKLLLVDEDFSNVTVVRVGPLEPDWGFTSLVPLPGDNNCILALKVRETADG